jgi:peptidoglycan/xylan/chitin deacetylase (PgdA/CDA1 family)
MRAVRKRVRAGQVPISVLFYHRVADTHANDWTISTRGFDRQIRWLRDNFDLISLDEAQRRIRSGENSRPAVCITFDDGYSDNCDFAIPRLKESGIPCTYFVSWKFVATGDPFPHDAACGIRLRPNSVDELRELASAGIEIGAHTRSHADLGQVHDRQRLYDEIVTATRELQQAIDQPIRYFAFPYGLHRNLNAIALEIAREAGFAGVCSAYGGYNLPGDDAFHLQRIHADPEFIRLKNWLTIDPRKQVERFDFPKSRAADARQEWAIA